MALKENDVWIPSLKLSESKAKIPDPGYKGVWRAYDKQRQALADVITIGNEYLSEKDDIPFFSHNGDECKLVDLSEFEPLLERVWENGKPTGESVLLEEMRSRRRMDLKRLDPGVREIVEPEDYPVLLTEGLMEAKHRLVESYIGGR